MMIKLSNELEIRINEYNEKKRVGNIYKKESNSVEEYYN